MQCVIPGTNCKILARAIHALAKIGEEMYVEPTDKSLSFRCVAMSHSAYCDFTLFDNFFSSYSFGNSAEKDALKCKISMRSALTVFKSPSMIDKLVETCHIRLESNAETLIFVFKFKNSVVKTFFLPIIDCEDLSVPYSKENVPNKLCAKSRVLTDAVHNFQQNLVEITVEVTAQKLLMRNYVDDTSSVANSTRTQLALTVCEFDKYDVGLDACITFCMKELRALLTFAETVGLAVNVYFESMGKPVVFDLKNPAFEANLVLSTLNPDCDDVSVSTAQEVRQPCRKRGASKKTPRQPFKAFAKRLTNKSTASNLSTDSQTTNTSARPADRNRSEYSSRMQVDEAPELDRSNDAANANNMVFPNRENDSNDSTSMIENMARKQTNFVASPSTSSLTSNRSNSIISDSCKSSGNQPGASIFSSDWKKRSGDGASNEAMDEDEAVPGSPPPRTAKKAKLIFKKCFQTTFDPRMLPGHEDVLADDTDDDM